MKIKINSMKIIKLITQMFLCMPLSFANIAHAEEWKNCDVGNSTATQRDAAIAFGKIEKRLSFFKNNEFASVAIFLDGKSWKTADLIQTGRRIYGDGKPFNGYADKTNSLIVQEFEDSDIMIVTLKGDVEFTMFSKCR